MKNKSLVIIFVVSSLLSFLLLLSMDMYFCCKLVKNPFFWGAIVYTIFSFGSLVCLFVNYIFKNFCRNRKFSDRYLDAFDYYKLSCENIKEMPENKEKK